MISKVQQSFKLLLKPWPAKLTLAIISLISAWLILSGILLFVSSGMIFYPERSRNLYIPKTYDQKFLTGPDGLKIDAWLINNPSSNEVVLYLHGNAGRVPNILMELSKKYKVFSPSYPGFALSEGSPTSQRVLDTAAASYQYLLDNGFKENQIIVYGHSLGGSPAVYLASTRKPSKLILVNVFSSIQSMCQRQFGIFCIFGGHLLNSTSFAPRVECKTRQFHLPSDQVVPYAEGRKLFETLASQDKKFTDLPNHTHNYFEVGKTLED